MATDLQDAELLAKISGGDLTEIEAKYHLHLLLKKKAVPDKIKVVVMAGSRISMKQELLLI